MKQRVWRISYPSYFTVEVSALDIDEYSMEEVCLACESHVEWEGAVHASLLTCVQCHRVLTILSRGIGMAVPIVTAEADVFGHHTDRALVLTRLQARLAELGVDPLTAELVKHDFIDAFTAVVRRPNSLPSTMGLLHTERLDAGAGVGATIHG